MTTDPSTRVEGRLPLAYDTPGTQVAPEDVGPPPKLESRAVKKMKPPQLKEELKLRNLSTQGNAKQLLARLLEAAC